MAIINRFPQGGSGDISKIIPNFPKGYVMKSTALGDVFPGWSADIYPVCIDMIKSRSSITPDTWGNHSITTNLKPNGSSKNALYVYADVNPPVTTTLYQAGTAYSVFLPFFYDFDWELIKEKITSGTCTVWLESEN